MVIERVVTFVRQEAYQSHSNGGLWNHESIYNWQRVRNCPVVGHPSNLGHDQTPY